MPRALTADAAVPGRQTVPVHGVRGGRRFDGLDEVIDEVPVALEFNGVSHAVMLATPCDLEDFALGFSLTEGLLRDRSELFDVEVSESPQGITVALDISAEAFTRLKGRRRNLAGRTGCGLCGTESLQQAIRAPSPVTHAPRLNASALRRALGQLRSRQPLQQATGACHAAAWCALDGEVRLVREDVGRHNALDKLIGALVRAGLPAADGFALITSRASYEMVHKAASAGIGVLAAISAPTALAVRTAEAAQLSLLGFARDDEWVAYSYPERIDTDDGHR
ncbi:MAG: formate dehydrogenase accessory sulfurtransferase FdhD [Burkholderiaceae bacterium]